MGNIIIWVGLGLLVLAVVTMRKENKPIAWGGVWGFGTNCTPTGKMVFVIGIFVFTFGLYTWAYAPSGPREKAELARAPRGFVRATIKKWEDNGILQVEVEGVVVRLHVPMTCRDPGSDVECAADAAALAFAKVKLPPGTEVWAKVSDENIRKDWQSPGFAPVKMGTVRALNGDYMWEVLKQE